MPDHTVAPGDVIAGKYRIDQKIGHGAMGSVYSATPLPEAGLVEPAVAIKFLHPRHLAEPALLSRFVREAKVASRLESAHAARVLDVRTLVDDVTGEEVPFFVMELLEGIDLHRLVKESGPVAIPDAIDWLLQACEAVAEAHRQGVIHRDLKPANLFLATDRDGEQRIKVIDFGVSKLLRPMAGDGDVTATTVVVGTPAYMAPEQMRSSAVDERADIWALGVTLFWLLGGERPFEGESIVNIYESILRGPQPLAKLRPGVPLALAHVVEDTLRWNPDDRVPTVEALIQRLHHARAMGAEQSPGREPPEGQPAVEAADSTRIIPEPVMLDRERPAAPTRDAKRWTPWLVASAAAVTIAGVSYALGTSQTTTSTYAFSPSRVRIPEAAVGRWLPTESVPSGSVPSGAAPSGSANVAAPPMRVRQPVNPSTPKPTLAPPKRPGKSDEVWGMP
jgi:serine/threonine-protein kinase